MRKIRLTMAGDANGPSAFLQNRRRARSRDRNVNQTERTFTSEGEDTSENESGATFDNLSGQRLNGYRFFGKHYIEPTFPPARQGEPRTDRGKTDFYPRES